MDVFLFLQDLRRRIIAMLIAVFLASCLCYFFRENIWCLMRQSRGGVTPPLLIFIAPAEALSASLKISVFGGVFLSLPFIFYQVASLFRTKIFFISFVSLLLFVMGAIFAYCIVIPQALKFFLQFENEFLLAQWTVSRYLSFFLWTLFSFGLMFEMPLVLYSLTKFKVIKTSVLRKNRRYAVLIIFVVAGVLTPGPDVLSQVLLAWPMAMLYELSIWVSCLA